MIILLKKEKEKVYIKNDMLHIDDIFFKCHQAVLKVKKSKDNSEDNSWMNQCLNSKYEMFRWRE